MGILDRKRLFFLGPSGGTGEHLLFQFDLLWLGLVWSCFVFCLLFLLFYFISISELTESNVFLQTLIKISSNVFCNGYSTKTN